MGETGDTMVLEMLQGGGGIISSSVEREIRRGGGGERTLLEFLRERMDGAIRVERRRRTLKERFGLNGFTCCGPHWCLGPFVLDDDDQQGPQQQQVPLLTLAPTDITSAVDLCSGESPATAEGMNLAAALAVERQLRASEESDDGVSPSLLGPEITSGPDYGPAQNRMSLMRLLHETECEDLEREEEGSEMKVVGCDVACCVCMGRKKGAAFIPCGHTFCRVCSRELWLNRGSCPLCNRPILEILDIF